MNYNQSLYDNTQGLFNRILKLQSCGPLIEASLETLETFEIYIDDRYNKARWNSHKMVESNPSYNYPDFVNRGLQESMILYFINISSNGKDTSIVKTLFYQYLNEDFLKMDIKRFRKVVPSSHKYYRRRASNMINDGGIIIDFNKRDVYSGTELAGYKRPLHKNAAIQVLASLINTDHVKRLENAVLFNNKKSRVFTSKKDMFDHIEYLIEERKSSFFDGKPLAPVCDYINSDSLFFEYYIANVTHPLDKNSNEYNYLKECLNEVKGNNSEHINSTPSKPFEFTNNFNFNDEEFIYTHFNSGLVEQLYCSEHDLQKFIINAFQDKKQSNKKIKLQNEYKAGVKALFYDFYNKRLTKGRQMAIDYANLLCNHFEGYNSSDVTSNWAKGWINTNNKNDDQT
ncbi:MAG: hypothetical protein COA58_08445 [Bacteroidetes bacterium]|nr:MAG: hypothetical protein COA58_08445 [Bacteroidota bacterium]